jgi:hypothetical protein
VDVVTLKERLKDWTDFDGASYELGVVLGIFKDFRTEGGSWLDHADKAIFWSRNDLGTALMKMLEEMASAGILDSNEDTQFRWHNE